jgi:hypothetical protein
MKPDTTTTPLFSLALRHGLAVLAGFLIHHGIATDGSSASLITGMFTLLVVTLASWLGKLRWNWSPAFNRILDDNGIQTVQKLIGAVVSQALAAFSGYLATTPAGTFDVQNPEALTLFFANAAASRWKVHQLATGLPRAALMLAACLPLASCLNMTKQDGKIAVERIGLGAADAAILVARMQLAQALNDLEAAQHGGSNGDAKTILMKQLGVMAAQKALDAAERAVARERARLDAKQPLNVQPGGVPLAISPRLRVSPSPSLPLSAGRPASSATPSHANSSARASRSRPAVPIYAPRIVAALRSAS